MNNIWSKIKYFFLVDKQKQSQKKMKRVVTKRNSKEIISEGASVTINSSVQKSIEEVRKNVEQIVKQTDCDAEKLLDYIKAAKTPIYKIDYADKILRLIGEEEGLICELRGVYALYLSLVLDHRFCFHTEPMLVLKSDNIDKSVILHSFYRWYSMKYGLAGFDYNEQSKFKKFIRHNSKSDTKKLNLEDIIDIQEAVNRDREATEFVLEYLTSKDGSKNFMDKLKTDGSANV